MAKKKSAGRPSKYTPALLEKAAEYVHAYEEYEHAFPSVVGLADVLQIGTSTIYEWAEQEDKKPFADILDAINRKQQLVAWNKGLKGEYNANLVKLLLGKHGYSEKIEQDNTSSDGSMTPKAVTRIELVSLE